MLADQLERTNSIGLSGQRSQGNGDMFDAAGEIGDVAAASAPRWIKPRFASFGWRYDFDNASFGPTEPIPDWLLPIRDSAATFAGVPPRISSRSC